MKYVDKFNLNKLFDYMQKYFKELSTKGLYILLLLFYSYKSEKTPAWAKRIILGALGYFLSPIDAIPDLTPFLGFTDDMSVMSFGLVTIACYIDSDVRNKSIEKLQSFIGHETDFQLIEEVDSWL